MSRIKMQRRVLGNEAQSAQKPPAAIAIGMQRYLEQANVFFESSRRKPGA
jgi:hypothetical protein